MLLQSKKIVLLIRELFAICMVECLHMHGKVRLWYCDVQNSFLDS